MKKILLANLVLLSTFSLFSCKKEDGNISDWVGEYKWIVNKEEKWHQTIIGEKSKQSEKLYDLGEYNLRINSDKTWFQRNSDKIETSGYSGQVRCFKDYICFVDMPSIGPNFGISEKFEFKLSNDSQGTFLKYYLDESVGKVGLDYDYNIRTVTLRLVSN